MERVKVSPDTVTVLGNRVTETDASWAGLDLARAEPRFQSTLMLSCLGKDGAPPDIHLAVPWCHPDNQTGSPDDFDCVYRVRPKMEVGRKWKGRIVSFVGFERWDNNWWIVYETTTAGRRASSDTPTTPAHAPPKEDN